MAAPAGAPTKFGGRSPLPLGSRPGGWTPPGVNRGWTPPGTNRIAGPRPAINDPQDFTNPKDIPASDVGRGVNDLAGGSKASPAGADTVGRPDFAQDASAAANAINQRDLPQGASSAAEAAKELYDREYARDLLNRWSWWSYGDGRGYSSDGGYGSSDSGSYSNPYSAESAKGNDSTADAAPSEQNDSAQTTASGNDEVANTDDKTTAVKQCMDVALRAFQTGDYAAAQKQSEKAIELQPGDANLREFHALCQFAQGNYKDAAATLYKVLAARPGWNWNTLSSLYARADVYTKQLRTLEQFINDNPTDAPSRFVLAYHCLVLDERDAALQQLHEVATLQPQDKVSAGIVRALEKAKKNNGAATRKPVPRR